MSSDCNQDASNGHVVDSDEDNMIIDEEAPPAKIQRISDESDEESQKTQTNNKPIQKVLNRAKPLNHSTQTRYQTRTQSDSLPNRRNSSYSNRDVPFATNTKISLIDLASKLAAADKRVNGKKVGDKKSPLKSPNHSKSLVVSLKKKMQSLNATIEEDKETDDDEVEITSADIKMEPCNGTPSKDCIRSPEMLQSSKYQVVKVDLFQETPEKKASSVTSPQKSGNARSQVFLQDEKVRLLKRNLALNQKRQELHDQAKQRELQAIKLLEEQRAKQKEISQQQALFHAKAMECFNVAFELMEFLLKDPLDVDFSAYVPKPSDNLPLWPLIANMTTKLPIDSSGYSNVIETAIKKESKKHRDITNVDEADMINEVTDKEYDSLMGLALNHLLRSKIPRNAKRAFEAAKYGAESSIKSILLSEETRREREASGFCLTPRNVTTNQQVLDKSYVKVSPNLSGLIPVPVNLVPVQVITSANQQPTLSLFSSPTQTTVKTQSVTPTRTEKNQVTNKNKKVFRFTCHLCNYQTDNRSHFRRHMVTLHSDIKPFACYVCDREFSRSEKCKKHIVRQHPEVTYDPKKARKTQNVDPFVSDIVPSPIDLSKKSEEKTTENNLEGASGSSDSEENAANKKEKSSPAFPCRQCNNKFWSSWHLKRHISEVHAPTRRMKCSVCLYATSRRHRLISHMQKHGEYFCFHCYYSSTDITEYRAHLRLCSEKWYSNSFPCKICNELYPSLKLMQLHMKKTHQSEVYFCEMCSFSSPNLEEIEAHSDTHYSGDQNQCGKCDKIFSEATQAEHDKICEGSSQSCSNRDDKDDDNDKYKCSVCSFSCTLLSNINTHFKNKHKTKPPEFKTEKETIVSSSINTNATNTNVPAQSITVVASSIQAPIQMVNRTTMQSNIPVNLSTIPVMNPVSFGGAIQVAVNPMPVNAIPVYTNQIAAPFVTSGPMPLSLTTSVFPSQNLQGSHMTRSVGRPKGVKDMNLYDENTGGLKGHGSGSFICPHCPDRPPFKYCGSYIKHMYKHRKAQAASNKSNGPVIKIKCPFDVCFRFFNTNRQVEKHLRKEHGFEVNTNSSESVDKNVEVIDVDSQFSVKNEPTIEISEDEENGCEEEEQRDGEEPMMEGEEQEDEEEQMDEEEEEEAQDILKQEDDEESDTELQGENGTNDEEDIELVEDTVDDTVIDHSIEDSDLSDRE